MKSYKFCINKNYLFGLFFVAIIMMYSSSSTQANIKEKPDITVAQKEQREESETVGGTNTEATILKKMPDEIIERVALAGRPDEMGMVGRNRENWIHVVFQRHAMLYLEVAAIRGDKRRVDDAWRAIDVAFDRQTRIGNFEIGHYKGLKPTRLDDLSGVSFWIAHLCHAIIVLNQSDLSKTYTERVEILLPKIKKSISWLYEGRRELYEYDSEAPNRLFFDALAFGLSGILLDDEELKKIGKQFAQEGLKLQREDGVFLEKKGHDSSYQAVALLRLFYYGSSFPDAEISRAIKRGIEWEINRVKSNGEVDVSGNTRTGLGQEQFLGRPKDVDYKEVILSLLYYGVSMNDENAVDAAIRVFQYYTSGKK